MADVIRDVVIRLAIQQAESKIKPPDLSPVRKAHDDLERQREKHHREEQKRLKVEEQARKQAAAQVEGAARAQEAQQQRLGQTLSQTGQRFKEAGEGAFILARGLAFTFSGTDEGLQKMLKNVAQVQGMFDIFKGGIGVVQKLGVTMSFSLGPAAALIAGLVYAWNEVEAASKKAIERASVDLSTFAHNIGAVRHELDILNIQASGKQKVVELLIQRGDFRKAKEESAGAAERAFQSLESQRAISGEQERQLRGRIEFARKSDPANLDKARAEAAVGIAQGSVAVEQKLQQVFVTQESHLRTLQRIAEAESAQLQKTLEEMKRNAERDPRHAQNLAKITAQLREKSAEQNQISEDLLAVLNNVTRQNVNVANAVAQMERVQSIADVQSQ